jgi:hypothetical protein
MSGQVSLGSVPPIHDTKKTGHTWENPLAQQTEQAFDPSRERPRMLYELSTQCPQF